MIISSVVFTACNSDSKPSSHSSESVTESVDMAVPKQVANESLYGVWEFRAEVIRNTCSEVSSDETIIEEYRIVQTEDGCIISDNWADGNRLNNEEELFDDEMTECQIGGNVITLRMSLDKNISSECHLSAIAIARLELEGDRLRGGYAVEVDVSDECSTGYGNSHASHCESESLIVGVKLDDNPTHSVYFPPTMSE